MQFNLRLQEAMDARGLKQVDLSRLTGLSTAQINHLVSGRTKDPKIKTFLLIADALGVSLDYLAGRTDVPAFKISADESEIVECYRLSTPERRQSLMLAAQDYAAMSKEGSKATVLDRKVAAAG